MADPCYLCGCPVYSDVKGDCAPVLDHIGPVSRVPGYAENPKNSRWVHVWCKMVKGSRPVEEAQRDIQSRIFGGTAPRGLTS